MNQQFFGKEEPGQGRPGEGDGTQLPDRGLCYGGIWL